MTHSLLDLAYNTAKREMEEKISKRKAIELFESGCLDTLEAGKFATLAEIHRVLFSEIYMKGIDASYYYEGYTVYKTEEVYSTHKA